MIAIPELEAWLDAHDITWVLKADIPGATFPPIVLNDIADGLVPLGGNHRIAAARRAGRTHLDAYVLTAGRPPSAALAPRSRLLSDLAGIIRYQPEVVDNDCRTVEQRAQLSQQIRAAARVLMAIDKEISR